MNRTLAAVSAALFAVGAMAGPSLAAPPGHGGGGGGHVGGGGGGGGGGHAGGGGGHIGGGGGGGGGFAGPRHIAPPQIAPQRPTYVPNVRPDTINRHHKHHHNHRHGRRIIIGAPYYGGYYDYGYRSYNDDCDYLWQRWQRTGNPKWKARYYRCID